MERKVMVTGGIPPPDPEDDEDLEEGEEETAAKIKI